MHPLALPDDPTIEALDATKRAEVARVWRQRAASELSAGMAFASIAQRLIGLGQPAEVQYLAARAVADEVRHCAIALQIARAYGSTAKWPTIAPPASDDATDRLIVATCCVNETLGGAFLQESLDRAEGPTMQMALRALLKDEVDHGRIGWAFVTGLNARQKAGLSTHLAALLHACVRVWTRRSSTLPKGLAAHGVLGDEEVRRTLTRALKEVVIPGFEHCGVPVSEEARAVADNLSG